MPSVAIEWYLGVFTGMLMRLGPLCTVTMSTIDSPVSAVFDIQRRTIEQTHESFVRGVEVQRELGESVLDFGPAKQANERSFEAVRSGFDVYFDALDAVSPQPDLVADFRATVDKQLDTLENNHAEAIETVEANAQESSAAAEEAIEEFLAALDEQVDALLEAHAEVEGQTVEALEGLEAALADLQAEFEDRGGEVAIQIEEQVTEIQQQVEDVTLDADEAVDQSLEAIDGIGPAYADRLHEQGIETLEALAEASADAVAEATDVSEKQAAAWIEAAQEIRD